MMTWTYIANLRGPQGIQGPDGIPGPGSVPADSAVAAYVAGDAASSTKTAFRTAIGGTWYLSHFLTEAQRTAATAGTITADRTALIQSVITAAAAAGGGRVVGFPGKYFIDGTLVVPNRVHLDFAGVELVGNGANTVIASGYLDAGVAVSNEADYPVGGSGVGISSHYANHVTIEGVKVSNCGTAIRAHFFVQGSAVLNCDLAGANYAYRGTNSWGLVLHRNTFRSTVFLSDFVDWTTVSENAFEGCPNIGLQIGSGGSWTLRIVGNGFHWITSGEGTAIKFTAGVRNTVIESNHFESNKKHIVFGNNTSRGAVIRNNHLAVTNYNKDFSNPVTCLEAGSLQNSIIGPNDFEISGATTEADFAFKYNLNADGVYGNRIYLDATSGAPDADLAKSSIRATNLVEVLVAGSLDTAFTQPQKRPLAGTSGRTFEQYDRKYNFANNTIPGCTVDRTGGTTHVIDTFIDCTSVWVSQPVYFFFTVGGTNTYRVAGRIAGRFASAVFDARERTDGAGTPPVVSFSNNAGKLRITITGVDNPSNITGWVKAI